MHHLSSTAYPVPDYRDSSVSRDSHPSLSPTFPPALPGIFQGFPRSVDIVICVISESFLALLNVEEQPQRAYRNELLQATILEAFFCMSFFSFTVYF